jgi:hypothetical protein
MDSYKVGDFVKVTYKQDHYFEIRSYIMLVIKVDLIEIDGINYNFKLLGIIVKTDNKDILFNRQSYIFRDSPDTDPIKKITNKKLIKKLNIIYKLYLLRNS